MLSVGQMLTTYDIPILDWLQGKRFVRHPLMTRATNIQLHTCEQTNVKCIHRGLDESASAATNGKSRFRSATNRRYWEEWQEEGGAGVGRERWRNRENKLQRFSRRERVDARKLLYTLLELCKYFSLVEKKKSRNAEFCLLNHTDTRMCVMWVCVICMNHWRRQIARVCNSILH